MSARIAIQFPRASLKLGAAASRSRSFVSLSSPHSATALSNSDLASFHSSSTPRNPLFDSTKSRSSNQHHYFKRQARRKFYTSIQPDTHELSPRLSHDQAPFHTQHDNQSSHFDLESHPGSRAFGECEISALSDLFLQFAKTSSTNDSGLDDLGPYLSINALTRLLASVGEKPDEHTLKTLFDSINVTKDGKLRLDCFLRAADQVLGDSPARIVLVVGGPGSGKGALCERLEKECGAVHLSCGELLRSEVEANTPLGREVGAIMESGGLVSSAVVTALMRRRMRKYPGKRILLDGFPRSLENARDFVELCGPPELALHLDCDDTVLLERILARGGQSAKDAERAAANGEDQLAVRADDNIHTALNRLKTYHKHHRATMDWLKSIRVPIVEIDCSGNKDDVWQQLMAIGRLMRPAVKIPPTAVGQQVAAKKIEENEDIQWMA